MQLCSDDHEEVCFEDRVCPACAVRDRMREKIAELQDENDKLTKELDEK